MKKNELRKITFTSVFVAVAFVLSLITKFVPGLNLEMPQGGAIFGFAMVPLIFIGFFFGLQYGLLGGFLYGLTSLMLDGVLYHWASLFTDYLIAFGVLGITGLFQKDLYNPKRFLFIILLAGFLRYLSHSFGGAIIFAEYAPEGMNPWFYSFIVYNLPYMASSTVLTMIIAYLLRPRLIELAKQYDLLN
jgi:thiamine transporter